jgi:hypothetical protein
MRAALGLAIGIALGAIVFACQGDPPADGVCAQANDVFKHCGASLPMLESGSCAGVRKAVARCVVDHATTCDELGSLFGRIDQCVSDAVDGGDPLLPPDDLAIPGSKKPDAGHDASLDAPLPPPPPPPPLVDAAVDAPTADAGWTQTFSGTVGLAEEKSFATPALDPGNYTVTMTGSGDADLYVKVGTAATTSIYDCRPFLGTTEETCTVTVTTRHAIHVMVRGETTTSTFTVDAHP